ncbi:MAG: sigma-54-dependent Fis family transcriptional regulator, partial [Gammaproteobacteria bacterium]|nr:sigma-54-dependent Fis family transcriptional regulator [Gammaproteobacteria bacterium]
MKVGSSQQNSHGSSRLSDKPTGSRLKSILIVDDEPGIRSFLQKSLSKYFGLVELVENVEKAESLRQRCHFDLIISDIRLPGRSGVDWLKELRAQGNPIAFIIITAHADLDTAIEALRLGAEDFILKPFRMEQMLTSVNRCLERQQIARENFVLKRQLEHVYEDGGLIGQCEQFKQICALIKRVAPMPSTVLIEGESGTGKELAARAVHTWSGRSGSFVPINCGAMSAELLESELFGHIKGASTGASQAREGLFTYADGGTLFLDEIGEMPLAMQAHLLRVLEERRIRAVGSNQETPVDVRVIAATNRNLEEEVKSGNFREDLYFRLNVLSIRMPALREHKEDLLFLVRHFMSMLASQLGMPMQEIDDAEVMRLESYDWPGNVR